MTDLQTKTWSQVREFYKEKFGIEPDLVELAADFDVLKMCANGSSTKSISEFLELDYNLVEDILDKYFGFRGWGNDLLMSPMRLYRADGGEEFLDGVTKRICEMFTILERSLDEKWI